MKKVSIRKKSALDMVLVLLGGIILCFMGFYNTFPYVYNDCGTYFWSGFDLKVPRDRPIFYGLFLRHISLMTSLWLVILVQGVILSLILYYYFKYLSGTPRFRIYYIAFILFITFFTSASFHVSQLIPDIFTSVSILCLGLFLLVREMKTRDLIFTTIILIFAVSVHNSHFLISVVLLSFFTLVFLIGKFRKKASVLFISGKRILYTWSVVLFTFLMVCTVHYKLGGGFSLSRASPVFLMCRIQNMGLLEPYLSENCDKHHYKICEYKGKIPGDFLWDYNSSPLYKLGGWESQSLRDEYSAIEKDLLTTPKYAQLFLVKSIESTFTQFFCFSTGDASPQREGSPACNAISEHYPGLLQPYMASHQWTQTLNFSFINQSQEFVLGLCLLFYIACFLYPLNFKRYHRVILFILAGMFINALVCGTLSGVVERYQSRVIWLLPLPLFLIIANREMFWAKMKKLFL